MGKVLLIMLPSPVRILGISTHRRVPSYLCCQQAPSSLDLEAPLSWKHKD